MDSLLPPRTTTKGLLISAIFDDNPVIFIEHRWLHNQEGAVPENDYRIPFGTSRIICEGNDITLVAMSYMTIEAIHAADHLVKQGISCELIDLRSVKPIDWETIITSVKKTGKILAIDTGVENGSVSSEIISTVTRKCWSSLKASPEILGLPDMPTPTSPALTEHFYPRAEDIISLVGKMMGRNINYSEFIDRSSAPNDVPGEWFKGPF